MGVLKFESFNYFLLSPITYYVYPDSKYWRFALHVVEYLRLILFGGYYLIELNEAMMMDGWMNICGEVFLTQPQLSEPSFLSPLQVFEWGFDEFLTLIANDRSYFTPAYHYHLHHHQLKQQKLSCSLFQSPKSYHLLSNSIRPSFFLSSSFGYNEAVMMFHATASDQTLWVKKKTAVSWRDDSNLQWQPCSFSSFSLSSDSTPLSEPLILLQDPLHSYSPICYASFLQLIIIPFLTFFLISFIYLFLVSSINYFHNCPSSINFFTALTFFLVLFLSQEWEADID